MYATITSFTKVSSVTCISHRDHTPFTATNILKRFFFPEKLNTIPKYAHTIYHVKIDFKPKFKVIKMYFVFCI